MAYEPSLELLILFHRLDNGDLTAIEEIWPLLFDEPLDPKRPAKEVINDLAEKIKELMPSEEPPKPTTDDLLRAAVEIGRIFGDMLATSSKRKP